MVAVTTAVTCDAPTGLPLRMFRKAPKENLSDDLLGMSGDSLKHTSA